MGEVSIIGLDVAKSVFQLHGVDDADAVTIRKRVSRSKMLDSPLAIKMVSRGE